MCMGARNLKFEIGIVIRVRETAGPFEMHLYEIMKFGGLETYTSAAVRTIKAWKEACKEE